MDLSHPAKERQCEAPVARHDADRRHNQWISFSSGAPTRRPKRSLAESGPQADQSSGRRRWRHCHARDRTRGEGTRTRSTRRSEKSSRSRRSEGEKIVVGHHAKRAPGLDLLDHLSQAARDACAPDQECLLNARYRKATRMLLRYVWVLQQEHERS